MVGPTAVGSSASSQTSRDSHWLAVSELSMLMSPRLDARGNDACAGGGGAAAGGVASRPFSGKGTSGLRADVSFSFGFGLFFCCHQSRSGRCFIRQTTKFFYDAFG